MDADIVLVDPGAVDTDWFDRRVSLTDWSAFRGMPALFPERVWRRGEAVVVEGALQHPGGGRLLASKRTV